MSDKTRSDAQAIIDQIKEKFDGQTMSEENKAKVQAQMLETAGEIDVAEAAGFTEEIIKWLNQEWNDREFTLEQRIFSIALATVNLRNHLPEEKGGKQKFDEVARAAWEYYNSNRNG